MWITSKSWTLFKIISSTRIFITSVKTKIFRKYWFLSYVWRFHVFLFWLFTRIPKLWCSENFWVKSNSLSDVCYQWRLSIIVVQTCHWVTIWIRGLTRNGKFVTTCETQSKTFFIAGLISQEMIIFWNVIVFKKLLITTLAGFLILLTLSGGLCEDRLVLISRILTFFGLFDQDLYIDNIISNNLLTIKI